MNHYEAGFKTFQQLDELIFQTLEEYVNSLEIENKVWLDSFEIDLTVLEKTGILRINNEKNNLQELQIQSEVPQMAGPDSSNFPSSKALSNSQKENSIPIVQQGEVTKPVRVTRQMQKTILSSMQPELMNQPNVQVKVEAFTEVIELNALNSLNYVKVKEEMPPPSNAIVRNARKKKGIEASIKIKSERLDEHLKNQDNRDSDVQIQKQPLETIVLEDSVHVPELNQTRTTRARTKKLRKDIESETTESQSNRTARTKRNKKKSTEPEKNDKEDNDNSSLKQSLPRRETPKRKADDFNDLGVENTSTPIATSESNNNVNKTHIINKPTLMNTTIVITNPTQQTLNDIMTDDEDVVNDSPPRPKRQKTIKAVFSPYDHSPVKKKVEAFEKLGSNSKLPVSRFIKNPAENDLTKNTFQIKTKEISKLFGTPLRDNKLRHLQTSSASKVQSNASTRILTSLTSNKAATGLKTSASKTEFRERELRRKQKESDALQKKEALMLAQIEEKRKKREEREMKVQQVKIAMEKDKQKQLEMAEKAKNEKLKQLEAEKEAKYMKQKEELAKKRAAASKRAQEAKQKEEISNKKYIPPYLQYETPLLPTPDCYDSDDSSRKKTIYLSSWQKKPQIRQTQLCMRNLETLKKIFFLSGPRTPDLLQIFPSIQPSKLTRTSSAIWNKTEMSILENMTEDNDE